MSKENISLQTVSSAQFDEDRRRAKRIELQIPLFVRRRESSDEHSTELAMELAKTLDISALGAFIVCPLSIRLGQAVTLTIPVPSITTSALVPAAMQPIQARVTRRQESGDAQWIGVEFLKPLG
jgi:hypothetical protein